MLQQMYWYDIILMLNEYHEMNEENEKNNKYNTDFEKQQSDISSKFSNMSSSMKMPDMGSITSGFRMPSI